MRNLRYAIAFAIAYAIAACISDNLRIHAAAAPAIYLPAGLCYACAVWFGPLALPICAGCELAIGLMLRNPAELIFNVPAALARVAIALMLLRSLPERGRRIERLADVFVIVMCAFLIASPLGGRWQQLFQMATGDATVTQAATATLPWGTADGLGVIVVAPLALLCFGRRWSFRNTPNFTWWLESTAILLSLAIIWLVFWSGHLELGRAHLPSNMGMLPFCIWSGLRLGRRFTSLVGLAVTFIVLIGTVQGFGPFGGDLEFYMTTAQLYVALLAETALLIAVVIAERQQVEDELQQRELQLRLITDSVPVLIGQFDQTGVLRFANRALQDWFGQGSIILGQKSQWLFNDTIVGAIESSLRGAAPPFHATLRHPRLGERHVEGRVAPQSDANGEILGGVILLNDVTEQRNLEGQLRQAMKMEAVGQLAGGIAHDFNNLLSIITGNLSLVEDELPANVRPMVDESLKACRRGASLVAQLLTFGRKLPVVKEKKAPAKIIEEVLGIVRATFDRRIDIVIDVKSTLPAVVVDAEQIEQVMLNLFINARDALLSLPLADSPRIMQIRVSARAVEFSVHDSQKHLEARPGYYVEFTVADTGVGLRPEIQSRVFEPFFTTKEVGKGTGLGLSSAYGAVRQHGGWITVHSQLGKGATFRVYLPAVPSEPMPRPELPKKAESPRGDETILVVDDEEMIRRVAKRILSNSGYTVMEAVDGQHALEMFIDRHDKIELVILDLSMPRMSGAETLTRLRLFDPQLPVIVSSGYDLADQPNRLWIDTVTVVAKPYRNQDLLKAVRTTLDAAKTPNGKLIPV